MQRQGQQSAQAASAAIKYLHQGRLNQWPHWARAQGPRIFFLFEGPQLAVVKLFFKLIILLLVLLHDRTNTSSAYLVNLTRLSL